MEVTWEERNLINTYTRDQNSLLEKSPGKNCICKMPWHQTNYELTHWYRMKLQSALLKFFARSSSSTKSLDKSETALLPCSGPLSGLESHPQKRNSCESPTGEVTLLLGHKNSQVKVNTSETKEHLAGQETWTTGRKRLEEEGKESENEDREKTQVLPQKLESTKRRPARTSGQGWKTSESESFSHLWECSQKIRLLTVKEVENYFFFF